jgi:two-component system NtrC family response regulator
MASSDLSIFIWGERGTGKQSLARAIHNASPRRNDAFISVDAAAEDPASFHANFFGQAKDWSGAREERCGFLEEATGGTLFLDEIDCLSLPMQLRLKRVIQTGEFYREGSTRIQKINVRFIVASNHDLTAEEYKDKFSRDLLYHLMINSIRIPPLRERIDDIPLLAILFLEQENRKLETKVTGFSPEFIELLKGYCFPDNLQELRNIIAFALVNEESSIITVDSLSPHMRDTLTGKAAWTAEEFRPRALRDIELEHVRKMLEYYGNNKQKAAKELGVAISEMERILSDSSGA